MTNGIDAQAGDGAQAGAGAQALDREQARDREQATAERPPVRRGRILLALLPLAVFLALATIFWSQLNSGRDISEIPSALIGTKAPTLSLPPLEGSTLADGPMPALTDAAIRGKLTLVNVWASWCIPCREENPAILQLSKDPRLQVVGINYKDQTENALRFLGELGNPFSAIGVDPRGRAAIDWGVYGIPESYLVGPDGTILYKRVGPFDERSLREGLMPAVEKASAAQN
jgi:cytochrome c biogenesis protein CcmG/thiol:disulfide interchange protein DsbE